LRWIETGKGSKGSVFVRSDGVVCKAIKKGKTVGGLQIWQFKIILKSGKVKSKTVYLKSRRELKEAVKHSVN